MSKNKGGNPHRCPNCGRMGSARPDHLCRTCVETVIPADHIKDSYIDKPLWCEREFVPKSDTFGLEKGKFGYER